MSGVQIPLTFKIFKGDDLVRTETLTQPVIKIGKLTSSHLRVDDDSVSRMHAVIEVSGSDVSIIDLGSTKGTIVNGEKVNKAKLADGDIIVLGDTRLVLTVGEAVAAAVRNDTIADNQVIASSPRPPSATAPNPILPAAMAPAAPAPAAPAPAGHMPPPGAPSMGAPGMGAPPPGAPMAYGVGPADIPGKRSIEVAAMLSDSIVAVAHLHNPKSGKVTGFTYGLYAAGAALLLMALVALAHGRSVAGVNRHALHEWEAAKKPIVDFRPRRMNAGWDLMTIFGIVGGIFTLGFAHARRSEERASPYFRIGRDKNVEFPTEHAVGGSFALVAPRGNDFVFSWAQGMTGEMTLGSDVKPLDQMPQTGPIPENARIRVVLGSNTFLISSVATPVSSGAGFLASLEAVFFGYLAVITAIMGILMFLLFSIPPDPKSLALDMLGNNDRLVDVEVKPPDDPKQMEDLSKSSGEDKSGGTGTKQAGDEGKMGKKESKRQSGQYAMKNRGVDPQLAKASAIETAQRSGFLGALASSEGGAFASLTGTGDFSSGLDDRDVYGGLIGNEVGEMQGGFGFGVRGTGSGGGGTGLGTIGLGNYGTIGHGSGTGSGYGIGSGKGGMRGRRASMPKVSIGNASASGDLDKNIIRRYIRQKLPQIRHCYERQLVVKANLSGTVTTQFVISGNGAVISSRAGGIGDSSVEKCVAAAIRSIQFPKPTGGGLVNVTYPFKFRPSGG